MPALAACAVGRNKLNFLDVGEERVHRAWVRRSHRTRKVLQLALGQKRDRAGDRVPSAEGLDDRRECRGDSGRGAAHEARGVHPHARREECPRGRRSHLCTRLNYSLRELRPLSRRRRRVGARGKFRNAEYLIRTYLRSTGLCKLRPLDAPLWNIHLNNRARAKSWWRRRLAARAKRVSAVDYATDAKIQRMIRTAFAGCTILVIAHRINTVAESDQILVLGDGRLLEAGPPAALLPAGRALALRAHRRRDRPRRRGVSDV